MKENMQQFENLVKWFKESKYGSSVDVIRYNETMPYDFCLISTRTLILGFCNKHVENHAESSYIYINGRVRLEHTKLFDKWRNCYTPSIHLPETKEDFDNLIKLMDYVGSDDFFNFFETPKDYFSYHDSGVESMNELYKNLEHLFDYNLNL